MKSKSAKFFLKISSVFFLVTALMSASNNDRFKQVIDAATNKTVKLKLKEFQKGGIERAVDTGNYDVEKVIEYAKTFLGTPHKMGGTSKSGIDCSGLLYVVHKKFGIQLPHSSHDQARYGKIIPSKEHLKRGDLLFFYNSYNTKKFITHAGIWLGHGEFIHTSANKGVMIIKLEEDTYWKQRYLFSTRLAE